jgi:N4-gp56 family major capsid protein
MQSYDQTTSRIGKLMGEMIAHADHVEVLGITGSQKKIPKNKSDTLVFRRRVPFGATTSQPNRPSADPNEHILQEGVTPNPDQIVLQDVTLILQEYGCLYDVSDKVVDLHEDDIPEEMKQEVGERMGLVREMIRYGKLKAGTNAYYSGGTSRSTVDRRISLTQLQRVTRNLNSNHTGRLTSILAPSTMFGTAPVEASWLVFAHTDCEQDIRALPNFLHVAEYGNRKPVHDQELGTCESFRFILSPELAPYLAAGAAVGTTNLVSAGAANVDVYPFIVVGKDAWCQAALRGVDAVDPTWLPPGQKDKNDPLGQRGYVGAKFWSACEILNQGWMAVIEAGVSVLSED